MLRLVWRGVLAHKLRLALSALSVVLGVAFVVGAYVLTDTMKRTFDTLFGEIAAGSSVVVQGAAPLGDGQNQERNPVPASTLATISRVPGVARAEGEISGVASLAACPRGSDGQRPRECGDQTQAIGSTGGPTLGVSWHAGSPLSALTLATGHPPVGPAEVAVDVSTAQKNDLRLGDPVTVLVKSGPQQARVVATFRFGRSNGLAGASLTAFDPAVAPRLLASVGEYQSIVVLAAEGTSPQQLVERVRAVVPSDLEVVTAAQAAAQQADQTASFLRVFRTFLLVFAAIALFVGLFIITNTFSILVAQRTQELALLRALGASRRQVTGSVAAEGLTVGLLGSTLGLGAGIAVAVGLKALFGALGVDLPSTGLVIRPRTVVAAYAVGVLSTLAASLLPARRAGRVPPMAALRDDVALPERSLRRRAGLGFVLLALSVALLARGLGGGGIAVVGLGALALFLGVTALSPLIGRPVVGGLGALLATRGPARRLGRSNAARNPRRTAATASALMVGIALVSGVSVLAASVQRTISGIVGDSVAADLVIQPKSFQGFGADVPAAVAAVPEVDHVNSYRTGRVKIDGVVRDIQAVDPGGVTSSLKLRMIAGSANALQAGQILVDRDLAAAKHWQVGDHIAVSYARTGRQDAVIGGIFARNQIAGALLWPQPLFQRNFGDQLIVTTTATFRAGVDPVRAKRAVIQALAHHPALKIQTRAEFVDDARKSIGQALRFIVVLLGLAVLIAAIGIVNTLALSVVERTREIGLLRAVGMQRRQVRTMVRTEAILIAIYGGVLGTVVGTGLGIAVVRALQDQGFRLALPYSRLASYILVAALLGVVAAILPARRAARLDVLKAVSEE